MSRSPFLLALLIALSALPLRAQQTQPPRKGQPGFGIPTRPVTIGRPRTATAKIPAPKDVLGFTPGDDRKLANWDKFVAYYRQLDAASDRVVVEELGKTTLGRPFLALLISSPGNLARRARLQEIQALLADPRRLKEGDTEAERLIGEGKTVVLITCGIHSNEVGANLVGLNLAYRLASDDSDDIRAIRDNCVVVLVPSLNPDGVDIVADWYNKTLGSPLEGTSPPMLYHHYTGHDNNRDWYAFTQVETQLTVDRVHNVWHPQIVMDFHQQGATESRMFLPPYLEPWEPNVPPIVQAGVNFLGQAIAWDMAAAGKSGVFTYGSYDAWTPARSYQHYHGGLRILSETASVSLATPITIPPTRLGTEFQKREWNFPMPWPGGDWTLANIVDYMETAGFSMLNQAARQRERWLRGFYRIGKDAVAERKTGEPFAFLLPPGQTDWQKAGVARIESILRRGQVEVETARGAVHVGSAVYPAGTRVVRLAQPYGGFAKTLLERQTYPDLRQYPGGPPLRPYDVTAHTLPLLMGTTAVRVDGPIALPPTTKSEPAPSVRPSIPTGRLAVYQSAAGSIDEGWTRWTLDDLKVPYATLKDAEARAGGLNAKYDVIVFPDQSGATIVGGLPAARYPAELAGGLGDAGVAALKAFVENGGTVVTLNQAYTLATQRLGVPVKNALSGLRSTEYYCPGSILQIAFDPAEPLAANAPPLEMATPGRSVAWSEDAIAFETTGPGARVVARFADKPEDVLLSGWLLGADKIAGKGAIVEAKIGKGRVVLFGFRPQYRGQSLATLPFLFNCLTK